MELDFSKNINDSTKLEKILADQKSRKQINDLPDSDFAYIQPGGKKVDGKTVPRSLRHLPIMDCAHVRNALARLSQTKISAEAKAKALVKIKAAAKKCKIEVSESDAKDWEKIDTDELKRDTKKEKKEHHKDAVEDDDDKIKKLKKGKPSEKKSIEIHDLKKDIKYDKKKESQAVSDKQKAARDKFMEMIKKKKKKGGDKEEDKDDDKKKDEKGEASSPYNTWGPVNNLDMEKEYAPVSEKNQADDESLDKEELKRDDKKEKKEHEKDAIKDDEKQIKDLKKDEDEDEKDIKEDDAMMKKYAAKMENDHAMLKMKSRMGEIDKARKDMEVEKAMMQKKLDAMMKKMRAADAS